MIKRIFEAMGWSRTRWVSTFWWMTICCFQSAAQLQFTENRGQWDTRALYRSDIFSGTLYLERQGFTYLFVQGDDYAEYQHRSHQKEAPSPIQSIRFHTLKTEFVGAGQVEPRGDYGYSFYRNYFIGRDRSRWASKVPVHKEVRYPGLYEGIDLRVYSENGTLKCDWELAPGADPAQIVIRYAGAEDIFLDDGRLYIRTSINHLVEDAPKAWQWIEGIKQEVACNFVLKGDLVSYQLGNYDPAYPLVIDPPVLVFATYSGSSADNFGFTATYDQHGNLYSAGNVTDPEPIEPNGRYPATPGAFQVNPAGFFSSSGPYAHFPCDMAISKYDSSGQNLLWATYLGGTNNDYPHSLVVDNENRLVLMGSTYSDDFPVDTLAPDTLHGGLSDIVVVKFTEDGSALLGSTFVGGPANDGVLNGTSLVYNYADNFRGDVQVSRTGSIFVASCSQSTTGIPVTGDALQSTNRGGYDGLLFELDSSLRKVLWCTYWGGKDDDAFYALRIDKSLNLIAGGGTMSDSIPTSPGAIFPQRLGGIDGMVLRVNQKFKTLIASTYMGTNAYDQVYFVDFDLKNHVYVFGQTEGFIPVVGGAYNFPSGGQFLIKMDEDLDSVLMSTTLGNSPNQPTLSPTAFLVDNCYNIYFAGWGQTTGLAITPDALQPQTDGEDFYLGVLDKNAQSLIYATYFGGTQTEDHVDGGTSRFDKRGVVYHSICGSCPPYPCCGTPPYYWSDIQTTPGAAFPVNLSPRCSNASFKLDFNITYAVETDFIASPIIGCAPLTVNFTNRSFQGTRFEWRFGDGSIDTNFHATHVYTQEGKYIAYLWAQDSLSCNLVDSLSIEIEVIASQDADFEFEITPCAEEVIFTPVSSGAPLGYFWDFGDGTTSQLEKPEHKFEEFRDYTVSLVTNPGSPCADTVTKVINLIPPAGQPLFIPNVFTPGPDHLNPCYTFRGPESCDKVHVEIYNRYGQQVFVSDEVGFCWDGTDMNSGIQLPSGVYYVLATYQAFREPEVSYKGTVTLIRE